MRKRWDDHLADRAPFIVYIEQYGTHVTTSLVMTNTKINATP